MNSDRRRNRGFEVEQSGENQRVKKPQLAQDHPRVVAGTVQHRMNRIAQRTLEPIASAFMCPMAGSIALRRRIIARRPRVMPRRKPG
jgi:hypothetical protein